jgi:hypothetical protein
VNAATSAREQAPTALRVALRRIDEAAPHRNRAVDALRAFAILGVVLGHWLVTSLAPGGGSRSPLAHLHGLVPVSWLLQTLAIFFLVGGYSGAVGLRPPYGAWLRRRMTRLLPPAMVLVAVWLPFTLVGAPVRLALNPLWFLLVYAGLTALTPLLALLPLRAVAVPVAVVAGADLVRFLLDGPAWIGWVNVPAAWSVPYLLGMAWARGELGRRTAWALLLGGGTTTVALVTLGSYPASMVGVPGQAISNLDPPTLAAVAFGLTQVGLALLLRGPLARWMRRPAAWAPVALVNLSAMTVYCWHQKIHRGYFYVQRDSFVVLPIALGQRAPPVMPVRGSGRRREAGARSSHRSGPGRHRGIEAGPYPGSRRSTSPRRVSTVGRRRRLRRGPTRMVSDLLWRQSPIHLSSEICSGSTKVPLS